MNTLDYSISGLVFQGYTSLNHDLTVQSAARALRSGDMIANMFVQLNKEKENVLILFRCQSRMSKTCFVSNGKHPNWDARSEQTILWFHPRSQTISNTSNRKKSNKKMKK